MKIEEYAPLMRPMNNANPKSFKAEAPRIHEPMTKMQNTGMMATKEVLIDRASTWFIDRLTTSVYVTRLVEARPIVFSLTLSNTTIVS
jgi:hypothetical protein